MSTIHDKRYGIVSILPASACRGSVVCSFTGPGDLNVVVNRGTRLDIYDCSSNELRAVFSMPSAFALCSVCALRPVSASMDVLWVSCVNMSYALLAFDIAREEIVILWKEACCSFVDNFQSCNQQSSVHPVLPLVFVNMLPSVITVASIKFDSLSLSSSGVTGTVQVSWLRFKVADATCDGIEFLPLVGAKPQLAVLMHAPESKLQRVVRIYELDLATCAVRDVSTSPTLPDPHHAWMIAIPNAHIGGVIVASHSSVAYVVGRTCRVSASLASVHPVPSAICCGCWLNATQLLLGDVEGYLTLVELDILGHEVQKITLAAIGRTAQANALTCIADVHGVHLLFVACCFGDSAVISFSNASDFKLVQLFECFGPISDFALFNEHNIKDRAIVLASGINSDGRLHVVRGGFVVSPLGELEQDGVVGVWTLRRLQCDFGDSALVFSFITETRAMSVGESIEEIDVVDLDLSECSVLVCNLGVKFVAQVLPSIVRLFDLRLKSCASWNLTQTTSDQRIILATAVGEQLFSCTATTCILLEAIAIEDGSVQLQPKCTRVFSLQISCVAIATSVNSSAIASLAAIGFWNDSSVLFLSLPTLSTLMECSLGGEAIPRSLALTQSVDNQYDLYVSIGTGEVLCHHFLQNDDGAAEYLQLLQKHQIRVSTYSASLTPLVINGSMFVFAAAEPPCVVYWADGMFRLVHVNLPHVSHVTLFPTLESASEGIVLASPSRVTLARLDGIQRVHTSTIPVNATPVRVVALPQSGLVAMLLEREHSGASKVDRSLSVMSLSQPVMQTSLQFAEGTMLTALAVLEGVAVDVAMREAVDEESHDEIVAEVPSQYIVLASAFANTGDTKFAPPVSGRLCVYDVVRHGTDLNLAEVTAIATSGAMYGLACLSDLILATCNDKFLLYRFSDATLKVMCELTCGTQSAALELYHNRALVLDLVQSVTVMEVDADANVSVVARETRLGWTRACAHLDDAGAVVVADDCRLHVGVVVDGLVQLVGEGLLESVSKMCRGALFGEQGLAIAATAFGQVAAIVQLDAMQHKFVIELLRLLGETQGLLFGTEAYDEQLRVNEPIANLEQAFSFRSLSSRTQENIAQRLGTNVEAVLRTLAELET
eukprot:TRINITY_DN7330_c0_g1_i2.p1 TRINITY_DN7330_c0_g1~~TRINITY_DN7330_c0_g1_i2.p1  ORF type:complete len:1117 (+),score=201.37 TRINITY_DN7330_c0_g1_i2:938-4288(+)